MQQTELTVIEILNKLFKKKEEYQDKRKQYIFTSKGHREVV